MGNKRRTRIGVAVVKKTHDTFPERGVQPKVDRLSDQFKISRRCIEYVKHLYRFGDTHAGADFTRNVSFQVVDSIALYLR